MKKCKDKPGVYELFILGENTPEWFERLINAGKIVVNGDETITIRGTILGDEKARNGDYIVKTNEFDVRAFSPEMFYSLFEILN